MDLVVEFRSLFSKNLSALTPEQKRQFDSDYDDAKYSLAAFKKAAIEQLRDCYSDNVEIGNKAIVVKGDGSSRLDCDVVVCNPYRKYNSNSSLNKSDYIEGIIFQTEHDITQKTIINYPKVHLKNGSIKNRQENTNGNFKPTVRVLKNMKASMIDKGYITKELAPSYFLECLIYNSDNSNFRFTRYQKIADSIINQFSQDLNNRRMANYLVQNEQRKLFGTKDQQWNTEDATTFINQLKRFWKEY